MYTAADCKHDIFATPIWGFNLKAEKFHLPEYVEYINDMCENQESVKKNNYGGWQSHEDLHKEGIFRELNKSINDICHMCIADSYIQNMWANVNFYKDFNGQHTHDGLLSGVFHLSVPKNSGNLVLVDPRPLLKSNNTFPIKPEPLALVLFPSWLEHYVEPNLSNEPRISMSFNTMVDNECFK